jgi:acetyltransferase-like isoleucine patch superfamily enzyme
VYAKTFLYETVISRQTLIVRLFRFGCNYLRLSRLRRRGLHCTGISYIDRRARLSPPSNVTIGANCCIGKAYFYALERISVGDRSIVGDDVFLCTGSHDVYSVGFDLVTKPIAIGRYVWIGTGATILPGVNIGDGAVVGAMAVVSRDVPAGGVVVGNPAQVVKTGRPIPTGFDPLTLASIDYRSSVARLRHWISGGNSRCPEPSTNIDHATKGERNGLAGSSRNHD